MSFKASESESMAKDLPKSASNGTVSKSVLEKDIFFQDDVQIGGVIEAVVTKHEHEGMFVKICPGLNGFIKNIYMSDVFVTKPEILHPVGSKVKCRVLSSDGSKLNLTCKESMLKLYNHYILTSYEDVQKGQFYKGVIAQKTDNYILVLFFNDIKGIVPLSHVPKGSVFFEGQTVLCEVIYCNSSTKKLRLSLETGERRSIEEIGDFWDKPSQKIVNGRSNNVLNSKDLVNHQEKVHNGVDSDNMLSKTDNDMDVSSSDESLNSVSDEIKSGVPAVKAVIKSVDEKQMNIITDNTEGRVHITELGCTSEDIYPLEKFSVGQEIEIYNIRGFIKKKHFYRPFSTKKFFFFKECSTRFPPYAIPHDYLPGKSLMGFVKEVQDVSVHLWLSPYQIGVLHFLHFSENLKTIKSLHCRLKVGLSMKVSVLENNGSTVTLTKIEKILPQLGRNVIGLVRLVCPEHGLDLLLPFGYQGNVALTDIADVYIPVRLLPHYSRAEFLMCHVLEVNHQTKYCKLSLRKSRIYGKTNVPRDRFCPEITKDNIKVGNTMKGFVKSVSNSIMTVTFGRNLEGRVQIPASSSSPVPPIGSIAEVMVKEYSKDKESWILKYIAPRALK